MNNSKAGCAQSKKKLQMNKDLLKIRLLYNFDCIRQRFSFTISDWKKTQETALS